MREKRREADMHPADRLPKRYDAVKTKRLRAFPRQSPPPDLRVKDFISPFAIVKMRGQHIAGFSRRDVLEAHRAPRTPSGRVPRDSARSTARALLIPRRDRNCRKALQSFIPESFAGRSPRPTRHQRVCSINLIFCQIFPESPVVNASISFTARSIASSAKCWTSSAASLLFTDRSSLQ